MPEIEITAVSGKRDLNEFIEFPYRLYRDDRRWVAPLRIAVRDLLNTAKHPFYEHAEMQCFLARRNGKTAGRIAAIIDRDANQFHQERAGAFGFFESIDDEDIATRLLHSARDWLRDRGTETIRGPLNPSTNYECGILINRFDSSPRVMMTYNPPYYPRLLETAGLRKSKDLLAYETSPQTVNRSKVEHVATRALAARGMSVRPIRVKEFDREVAALWSVYNAAWSRNWGFAPMTETEFKVMAKDMKQILVPELTLVGEVEGRTVGFALALPDINQALRHAGGNLFPFGLLKILYYQRLIRSLRVIALGVVGEYQTAGVAAGFYAALIRNAAAKGYQDCELSWVLEDNVLMNRSLAALGARHTKTYRVYEWN